MRNKAIFPFFFPSKAKREKVASQNNWNISGNKRQCHLPASFFINFQEFSSEDKKALI